MAQTQSRADRGLPNRIVENQRALLPEMRPQAELISLKRRADLLLAMHGKVHGGVEPGQHNLHQPVTAGTIRFLCILNEAVGQPEAPVEHLPAYRYRYIYTLLRR